MESKGPRNFFVPHLAIILVIQKLILPIVSGCFFGAVGFKSVVQHQWVFSSGVVSLVIHPVVSFFFGQVASG